MGTEEICFCFKYTIPNFLVFGGHPVASKNTIFFFSLSASMNSSKLLGVEILNLTRLITVFG